MRKRELIELKSLADGTSRDNLVRWISPLVSEVFPGLEKSELEKVLFNDEALSLRFYLFTDNKKPIGFHLFSHYPYQKGVVFRVFSCLSESAKGDKSLENLGFKEILRARLIYPTREVTFFTCYVNPVPYYVMLENMAYAYPHHTKETPKDIYQQLLSLADHFNLEKVEGAMELVRKTPAIGTMDQKEVERINRSEKPAIKKFVEWCPTYHEGHGLVTMAPISWKNLILSLPKKFNLL